MVVEERTYDITVGLLPEYVRNYTEHGLPVSQRHGLGLAAHVQTETANLHQVEHFWLHGNLSMRQRERLQCDADPSWQGYQAGACGRVTRQEVHFYGVTPRQEPFSDGGARSSVAVIEQCRCRVVNAHAEAFAQAFNAPGLPACAAAGARLLAELHARSGEVHEQVNLWYWSSHTEREAVLAASAAPWDDFRRAEHVNVLSERRQFLRPIDPSPLR